MTRPSRSATTKRPGLRSSRNRQSSSRWFQPAAADNRSPSATSDEGITRSTPPSAPSVTRASARQAEDARGVVVVDLLQDRLGKAEPVDPPPPLRGDRRRRVVEVLVLRLQEPVVDLV